jgi:Rrf2 family transcriptional regulator, cysteine metabolism repressor
MKLSTKGRYGLKAMFDLAIHYGNDPIPLTQISERQNISVNYLEQLIAPLRKAGLVNSVRGAQGGYMLSKKPEEITVGEILVILEGSLAPSDCVKGVIEDSCSNAEYCATRMIYEKIKKSIDDVVYSISLQDMVDDHMKSKVVQLDATKCFC